MSTINISLPDPLKSFVNKEVSERGYRTSGEYVRELIRKEQDRERLRDALLRGAASPIVGQADESYFERLGDRIRKRAEQ